MNENKKIEALVSGLLEQCEKQELTISETRMLPQILKIHIEENVDLNNNQSKFKKLTNY